MAFYPLSNLCCHVLCIFVYHSSIGSQPWNIHSFHSDQTTSNSQILIWKISHFHFGTNPLLRSREIQLPSWSELVVPDDEASVAVVDLLDALGLPVLLHVGGSPLDVAPGGGGVDNVGYALMVLAVVVEVVKMGDVITMT